MAGPRCADPRSANGAAPAFGSRCVLRGRHRRAAGHSWDGCSQRPPTSVSSNLSRDWSMQSPSEPGQLLPPTLSITVMFTELKSPTIRIPGDVPAPKCEQLGHTLDVNLHVDQPTRQRAAGAERHPDDQRRGRGPAGHGHALRRRGNSATDAEAPSTSTRPRRRVSRSPSRSPTWTGGTPPVHRHLGRHRRPLRDRTPARATPATVVTTLRNLPSTAAAPTRPGQRRRQLLLRDDATAPTIAFVSALR